MKTEEAKSILLRYRPSLDDERDPETREALRMTQEQPALGKWFRAQSQASDKIRAELRGIEIPAGLKDQILARRKTVQPNWRKRAFLALAAAVVLLLGTLVIFWKQQPREEITFAAFQSRMIGFALREYSMDIETNDPGEVRSFLTQANAPADFPLPENLQTAPVKGGARLSWQGRPVAMMCFDWQKEETLYLFVIAKRDIQEGQLPANVPAVGPAKGVTAAVWSTNDQIFLLAGPADLEAMKKLVI